MRARLRASPSLVFIELMASGSRFRRDRIGPIIRNEPFLFFEVSSMFVVVLLLLLVPISKVDIFGLRSTLSI